MGDRQRQALKLEARRIGAPLGQAVHIHDGLASISHRFVLQDHLRHTVEPAKSIGGGQVLPGAHTQARGLDNAAVQLQPLLLAERGGVEHGAGHTHLVNDITDQDVLQQRLRLATSAVGLGPAPGVDRNGRPPKAVEVGAAQIDPVRVVYAVLNLRHHAAAIAHVLEPPLGVGDIVVKVLKLRHCLVLRFISGSWGRPVRGGSLVCTVNDPWPCTRSRYCRPPAFRPRAPGRARRFRWNLAPKCRFRRRPSAGRPWSRC